MHYRFGRYLLGLPALLLGLSTASAQSFSDSLTGSSLPAGLNSVKTTGASVQSGTGDFRFTAGGLEFNGTAFDQRTFVTTSFNDYSSYNFTATITATVPNNMFFFGMGSATSMVYPEPNGVIGFRSHSVSWGSGNGFKDGLGESAQKLFGEPNPTPVNFSDHASVFTIQWNAVTKTAVLSIVDYNTGGDIAGTYTQTVDGSDNGFTANNTFLYFGGVQGVTVSNFSVTASAIPEPSTYAAITAALAFGVVAVRRRRRA